MVRSLAKGLQAKVITPLVEFIELNKPCGLCFNDPNEWAKRTRGIQIKVLLDHDDQKISIWDLAGQEEYHALRDTMIPNLNIQGNVCVFLLVCNPFKNGSKEQKNLEEIKDELCYWLRFISSNTKRSSISPPQVMVVMTYSDKNFTHKSLVEDHLHNLEAKFSAFINISSTCYWINAHSSQEATYVTTKVTNTCGDILKKMVHIYEACMNVQHGLCVWNTHHPNQPIVTMETFEKEIIDKKEPNLRQLMVQQELEKPHVAVAMFLHDAGEMIYFKGEDFVVVDPSWFCQKVMGRLIKLRGDVEKVNLQATFRNGWGGIREIEHLLHLSL
jgi:negative regulator of replication initiation